MPDNPVIVQPKRFKAYIILIEVELIFVFLTSTYLAFQTQRLLPKLLMTLIWLGTIYLFYQTRLNIQHATDWEQFPFYDHLTQTSLLVYYLSAGFLTLTLMTIVLLFTKPLYDFYFTSLIHNRFLIPILLFIVLWSLETFIFFPFIFYRKKPRFSFKKLISSLAAPLKKVPFWIIFAFMLVIWGLISLTGIGVDPTRNNIIDLGVPLLESQTLYIVGLVAIILWTGYTLSRLNMLHKPVAFLKSNNLIIFVLIWFLTFVIWIAQPLPMRNNFILAPQPQFMNEVYPYADAALFDKSAISLWTGFSKDSIILRPFFVWFLSLFHRLIGFDYSGLVLCQTVVLALIPCTLFLIGKEIHHPLTGLFAAFAAILREVNAIQISNITVASNSKLLLSDLPCMLIVLFITWMMLKWYKFHRTTCRHALWVGILIGLGTLIRTQVYFLIPLPLILALTLKTTKKKRLTHAALILAGFLVAILPILLRNYGVSGVIGFEDAGSIEHYVTRLGPAVPLAEVHGETSRIKVLAIGALTLLKNPWSFLESILEHFIRNLMSTFLIFPIRAGQIISWKSLFFISEPFWANIYTVPNLINIIQILLQMFIYSIGFVVLFKRSLRNTLTLIGVYTLYAFSVSVGQFSGWRFILPVDWIGYTVYAVGIIAMMENVLASLNTEDSRPVSHNEGELKPVGRIYAIILTAVLVIAGALVPLQEWLTKPIIPSRTTSQICKDMLNNDVPTLLGMQKEDFLELCHNEDTVVANGLALYPQFYPKGNGYGDADWEGTIEAPQDFSRLFFTLIGPQSTGIYMRTDHPTVSIPNGSQVSIIGLEAAYGIEAQAILVHGDTAQVQTP